MYHHWHYRLAAEWLRDSAVESLQETTITLSYGTIANPAFVQITLAFVEFAVKMQYESVSGSRGVLQQQGCVH